MIATTIANITVLAALLVMTTVAGGITGIAKADNIDKALKEGKTVNFDEHNDGTTTWTVNDNDKSSSASASKADSASAARSENNVKCFAFCLGISNAKSASNANSESRTNSPGSSATAAPITQNDNTPVTVTTPKTNHHQVDGPLEQLYRGELGGTHDHNNALKIFDPNLGTFVDKK
jgi:hypothetical protein